jgi:ubiquinone/menaquinone biosynthesis C-methylase UbiE
MKTKIDKEKEFHNHRFEEDTRKHLDKYYSIISNTRNYYISLLEHDISDKRVLEYGCGEGSNSFNLAKLGAEVFGIDISDVAIRKAIDKSNDLNLDRLLDFRVMNAEELNFPDNYFNRICGTAILHHLELKKSLTELTRVLKKNGDAFFLEPLGHNPLINLYRGLTRNLRTDDEHPLKLNDLDLLKNYFNKVNIHYFHLITLLSVPFREYKLFDSLLKILNKIDSYLFRFTFFKKNAWIIVIELSEPKKNIKQ